MSKIPRTTPPLRVAVDEDGRALPLSDEELDRLAEESRRILADLDAIGDEQEQRESYAALITIFNGDRAR